MITRDILDHIGDAIYGVDSDWRLAFINAAAERFFGRDRSTVLGRIVWEAFPAIEKGELGDAMRRVMQDRTPIQVDILSPTTGRWADTRIFPLEEGGIGLSWRDINEIKKREVALLEAIENQDMLFRELVHRVTNNFQEVAARVSLQGRDLHDEVARDMCEKMAVSIRCMAMVHSRLYRSHRHIDDQDLGEYVRALCDDLASSLPKTISLTAAIQTGTKVAVDIATTVGMMVAELVMNSRKYAWVAGASGRIVVTMRREGDFVEIEVYDDGRGVPDGVDLHKSAGLGLKLLELQIRRLKGAFTYRNVEGGAIFLLRFPAPGVIRRKAAPAH